MKYKIVKIKPENTDNPFHKYSVIDDYGTAGRFRYKRTAKKFIESEKRKNKLKRK